MHSAHDLGVRAGGGAVSDSALAAHPWPGNVRELRHVLEAALLLAPRRALAPDDLRFGRVPRTPGLGGRVDTTPAAAAGTPRPTPDGDAPSLEDSPPRSGRAAADPGAPAPTRPRRPADPAALAPALATRHGAVTRGTLARAAGIAGEQARRTLVALVAAGQLTRVGAGRTTRYVVPGAGRGGRGAGPSPRPEAAR